MDKIEKGLVWIIPDGDLPPPGEGDIKGHESLVILNTGGKDASVSIDIYFEEREPVKGIEVSVSAERVKCFRLDKPLGQQQYRIPYGQYSMVVKSSVPVVVQFGRADVRQPNLAYYCTMAYPLE